MKKGFLKYVLLFLIVLSLLPQLTYATQYYITESNMLIEIENFVEKYDIYGGQAQVNSTFNFFVRQGFFEKTDNFHFTITQLEMLDMDPAQEVVAYIDDTKLIPEKEKSYEVGGKTFYDYTFSISPSKNNNNFTLTLSYIIPNFIDTSDADIAIPLMSYCKNNNYENICQKDGDGWISITFYPSNYSFIHSLFSGVDLSPVSFPEYADYDEYFVSNSWSLNFKGDNILNREHIIWVHNSWVDDRREVILLILGALLGAFLSALPWLSKKFYILVMRSRPLSLLLGDFANNDVECLLFLKELQDKGKKNEYLSPIPDYFSPHTQFVEKQFRNIPKTFAKADVISLNSFINILGLAGKKENITIAKLEKHWDVWDKPIASFGGNYKTEKILERCKPIFYESHFTQVTPKSESNELFKVEVCRNRQLLAVKGIDYGIIHKTKDMVTNKDVFLFIGLGCAGTEAAGKFFQSYAIELGKLFGSDPFIIVVKTQLSHGNNAPTLYHYYPEPKKYRKIIHPFIWRRFNRMVHK